MKLDGLKRFYEQVEPDELEAYLRLQGWQWDGVARENLGCFYHLEEHGEGWSVVVPARKAGDFTQRIADTVEELAEVEERQPTAVLFDLLPASARADFVREILPGVAK